MLLLLVGVGCDSRRSIQPKDNSAVLHEKTLQTTKKPLPGARDAANTSPATEDKPSASFFLPVTEEAKQSKPYYESDHATEVNLKPYCQAEQQRGKSAYNDMLWVRRSTKDLERIGNLMRERDDYVGIVLEKERDRLVVVMESSFTDWGQLQSELRAENWELELRPACHTLEQRRHAVRVLEELKQELNGALFAWEPDASFGGFRVFLLPGEFEAGKLVKTRLGSIVNVWYTREFGLH